MVEHNMRHRNKGTEILAVHDLHVVADDDRDAAHDALLHAHPPACTLGCQAEH